MQQEVHPRHMLGMVLGAAALVGLGVVFAGWTAGRQDRWMRDDLLYQARLIVQTLNRNNLQKLEGNSRDAARPEYRRLKEQLMAAQQINPHWQWIYLMGRTTNRVVYFQLDSEPYDAPDPSPPGQTYEEATPVLQNVFDEGRSATEGPVPDRWGTWVSAFVPVKDLRTGKLLAVLGIDIEASQWNRMRLRAMGPPLLAGLALLLLWLSGNFLLMRRARPEAPPHPVFRYLESYLALATGLVLTATALWMVRQSELRSETIAFRRLADYETMPIFTIAKELRDLEMNGFASFFESSLEVSSDEFQQYAAHLNSLSEVTFWGWADVVEAANRPKYEQQSALKTGQANFRIWEPDESGEPRAATPRKHYFPLVHLTPLNSRKSLLGLDLGADSARQAELQQALQTRLPTQIGSVPALQSTFKGQGILLVHRASRAGPPRRLDGLVVASLDISRWLHASLNQNPDRRPMAVIDLLELHHGAAPVWIGTTAERTGLPPAVDLLDRSRLTVIRPLLTFGRCYAVVARPTAEFFRLQESVAWLLTLAGLVLTGSISWMLDFFATRRENLARLVSEQARELAESMRHFSLLAHQNRVITWELDRNGYYVAISDMAETILGYRPDEIIGKLRFFDLCPEPDRERFRREGLQFLHRGEPATDVVNAMVAKSGQIVWVSSSGIPIRDAEGNLTGYWGTDTDITDRKRAEDELARLAQENQKAAARYATLISASNTGAWEYHDDTARMWASAEYFDMLGLDPARFLGADGCTDIEAGWLALLHPDDRTQAQQDFLDYLKNPESVYQHTFRMRHADGHWVWVLSRGRMLRDAAGRPTPMVVGTHIDITATQRIEEALRESERKYRTLFSEMLEGFALHEILLDHAGRPTDYRYLAVNPAFERMTGLRAQDILGKTVLAVLPETERKWIEIFGQVALTGLPAYFDSYSGALDKHFEVTAFRPAPGQFACIISDISVRKRAEAELQESRRQHAALLANLPGMAYRCRIDRDWTMEFVSDGCLALTGYSPEDLAVSRTVTYNAIIAPAFRQMVWDKWQEALRARHPCALEYQIITRRGETKWVWEQGEGVYDGQGRLQALEGFISDITERKRADAERDRLTRAIEQSTETVVITDANGAMLYVNPQFTKTSGYTREEALGRNPHILQSGWHDKAFYQAMWKTLRAGRTWEGQLVNKRKDGTLFTEQAAISPVRDAAGQIVHFVAVKRDITDQIRIQKEKEDLQVQLLHSQKMESIGRLAGGVAHDFNNMLQAILGYCEMALELAPPGETLHADLTEIQKAAQRSAALTRQLQIFARKQTVMPWELNLNESIAGMLTMLQRLIGEEIQLVWKPAENLGLVKMDPGQVDQILANLCLNSRDAIQKSGQITIATANEQIAGEAARKIGGDLPPGDYTVLSVHDDGCGMSPDVLAHIFEPFFTTKVSGKGTGLGLAIVYGIVTQNGGGIQVDSTPGTGTMFKIYLPRYTGEAGAAPPAEAEEQAAARGETILVVEDEETILQTTRRMLESLGYRVLATPSPKAAVELVRNHKGNLDLLITDVIMKDMNGPELVQELLKQRQNLKHLYMSGYAANLLVKQGVNSHRLDFIQKPFSRTVLAKAVRDTLRRA